MLMERVTAEPLAAPASLDVIDIEVSGRCNLKCAGCRRTTEAIDDGRGARIMALETFERILRNAPPFGGLLFTGEGEPTLNPHLPAMVALVRREWPQAKMVVVTNLLARDTQFYRDLAASGLNALGVSIDSLDQAVADRVRFGTKVEKLKRRLAALRATAAIPFQILIVVSRINMEDVFSTLATLNEIGRFQVMLADYMDKGSPDWCLSYEEKRAFIRRLGASTRLYPNLRIAPPGYFHAPRGACNRPFKHPAVNVDGHLSPCCASFNESLYGATSVATQSFAEAWRSPAVTQWLSSFAAATKESEPEICASCILNPRHWLNFADPAIRNA
jgi:MoaA/NifB/PqqE/SkfB family radical SAM enzyme